ncbi:MAG: zeta toxin [Alphaproteobacteria bacterium]|nr:zeta toxin [Alphaproteobacteria bacterium]
MSKQIHIIAGPNGAGKTSYARVALLPDFLGSNEFVNADEIAKVLSPKDPEKSAIEAGRLMLKRMEFLVKEGRSFAIETTLSAKIYFNFIRKAQKRGYKVNLFFLRLENVELARKRVKNRVSKGGHNIETEVIERRFKRGLDNLKDYLKIIDTTSIYEASGPELIEILKKNGNDLEILNKKFWQEICATKKS